MPQKTITQRHKGKNQNKSQSPNKINSQVNDNSGINVTTVNIIIMKTTIKQYLLKKHIH